MGNISNMSPFHTTGWKCFAESWACITFPREIDWDSGSIGHECGVVVSLGVGGVTFVLVWGCLCREHLCWTRSGTLGGLWAWGCCFCWVPLVFWAGSILFCRTKKKYVNLTINSLTKSLRRVMNMTHDKSSGLHLF